MGNLNRYHWRQVINERAYVEHVCKRDAPLLRKKLLGIVNFPSNLPNARSQGHATYFTIMEIFRSTSERISRLLEIRSRSI